MRFLIVEDDPIIAIDLEDIILRETEAEIVYASSLREAMRYRDEPFDFALLDIHLGTDGTTSLPFAMKLMERKIPFCFVSSSIEELPLSFASIPKVRKPFHGVEVARLVPHA